MRPAIRIEHLCKRYRIGAGHGRDYRTLRESLSEALAAPWGALRRLGSRGVAADRPRGDRDAFWALDDVSFEVETGEVVGIIGRNGAGKSTLLKVLSRITEPTSGRALLSGRVGSLLEVGTGFHAELTGRENIYLNGAILGMTRREIARRFDEIVAFAEVGKFLDTPVKRYSSGMYTRLAFAVAAHLDPEILIVDEVLSVGDLEFQRKCLGKMGQIARSGRTVLFVSHNMATVQNLCNKAVLLSGGRVGAVGGVAEVLAAYLRSGAGPGGRAPLSSFRPPGMSPVIREVTIYNHEGVATEHVSAGEGVTFEIRYDSPTPLRQPVFGVFIQDINGSPLVHLQTLSQHPMIPSLPSRGVARCRVGSLPLLPGSYPLCFNCSMYHTKGHIDYLDRALTLEVGESDYFGTGRLPMRRYGTFLVRAGWSFEPEPEPEPEGAGAGFGEAGVAPEAGRASMARGG